MSNKAIPALAWFVPLAPLVLAFAIYSGELQSSTFLIINQLTRLLPDTLWAWLTFLGNGWGVFAIAFPLLLLAPMMAWSSSMLFTLKAPRAYLPFKAFANKSRVWVNGISLNVLQAGS